MNKVAVYADELFTAEGSLLMRGSTAVLGKKLLYRLFGLQQNNEVIYTICVDYGVERAACYLRCGEMQAKSVFARLLRGRVTPCVLTSVTEDFLPDGVLLKNFDT